MPDSPSGVYSLPPSYKVANGDLTDASQHNPPFEDVQQALTNRLHRDGRTPWTGNQNANGNKLTNLKDGTDPQDAATVSQLSDLGTGIGDGKWSVNDLGPNWLRRDGALYDRSDYPDLADMLPTLPDGVTWETFYQGSAGAHYIVKHPSGGYVLFRAYSNGGTSYTDIYRSTNGLHWDVISTIDNFSLQQAVYGNSIWLAFDSQGRSITSPDLLTWASPVTVFTYADNPGGRAAVAFGKFWAVGISGSIGGIYHVKSSTDGQTWTEEKTFPSAPVGIDFLNGNLIVTGVSGMIQDTSDGVNWNARTSGVAAPLFGAIYGNNLYVAFGSSGTIVTSPNLSAWTQRTSGTSNSLRAGTYSSSGFMLVGRSGTATISPSTSGTSWSLAPTGLNVHFINVIIEEDNPNSYLVTDSTTTAIWRGLRTLPTQFRVPNDDPTYGWIRALP